MPMLKALKNLLKIIIPKKLFKIAQPYWHGFWALFAHYYFSKPSEKMVIIGVTGTKGKTSTSHIIYQILNELVPKPEFPKETKEYFNLHLKENISSEIRRPSSSCGILSTAVVDHGGGEALNGTRSTQMSGFVTHRALKRMFDTGARYAVIEVSSEGLAQNRHLGINFDIAVFTNLTPDHIEAHGSFENYKKAKSRLFATINNSPLTTDKKKINPKLEKTIVANLDSEHGLNYLNFPAQKHISYGIQNTSSNLVAKDIQLSNTSSTYEVSGTRYQVSLPGKFNIYNTLAATAVAEGLGFKPEEIARAVSKLRTIPGRMEVMQKEPFTLLIDYAHEKASMQALYETVKSWPHERIIQVFGATGGVRDKSRRTDLGRLAGNFADIIIATDEDPFDEDPKQIIQDIAASALATGKKTEGVDLFQIPDRRAAIEKAIAEAKPGDLVLITGKGAEQKIARANGHYEPWDDREIVKSLLLQPLP